MVSTPFGPYGQDDYFDQHKFDKMQEIYRKNLGTGMSPSDTQDMERRNPQSIDEARAYVESKKPVAKPTPSAAKKTAAKKPTPKPTAKKAPPKKK